MNNKITNVICFAVGAIIGSAVTCKAMRNWCEQVIDEVTEQMRNHYKYKYEHADRLVEPPDKENDDYVTLADSYVTTSAQTADGIVEARAMKFSEKPDISTYINGNDSPAATEENDMKQPDDFSPYVISPADFGEFEEYDTVTLTYYADGTLTDEWDEIIEDVDDIVGIESLSHFGEYEDDAVHVRNDIYRTDYEILADVRTYDQAFNPKTED